MKASIGDRIKRYEAAYDYSLTPRSCLFVRVDGKTFHTFTRGCDRPFDQKIVDAMVAAAVDTASEMHGFKLAYAQSDECTFMLTDFDTFQTQGWFDYKLNKIVSVSAAMFSVAFNYHFGSKNAVFDSRAFIVPADDAPNVFVWRQRDWERNSVQMLARAHFSHKQCHGKKMSDLHEMLHENGVNWADLPAQLKNGTFITKEGFSHEKLTYAEIKDVLEPKVEEVTAETVTSLPGQLQVTL